MPAVLPPALPASSEVPSCRAAAVVELEALAGGAFRYRLDGSPPRTVTPGRAGHAALVLLGVLIELQPRCLREAAALARIERTLHDTLRALPNPPHATPMDPYR